MRNKIIHFGGMFFSGVGIIISILTQDIITGIWALCSLGWCINSFIRSENQ